MAGGPKRVHYIDLYTDSDDEDMEEEPESVAPLTSRLKKAQNVQILF